MNIAQRLGYFLLLGLYLFSSTGCDGGGGAGEASVAPPVGATKLVEWEPSPDPTVTGYHLYYGTRPRESNGSCDYEFSKYTSSPSVTLTELQFNTRYFIAVSATNGQQGQCSDEISFVTAPA